MTNTPPSEPQDSPLTQSHYRAVLEWYRAMGVDIALSEQPTDWFSAEFSPFTPASPKTTKQIAQHTPADGLSSNTSSQNTKTALPPHKVNSFSKQPLDTAQQEARLKAKEAGSIEALQNIVKKFEGCSLKVTATKTCFCDGNPKAPLMIIGEAPGRDEDLSGKPFIGRAGLLLNKMLEAIAINRAEGTYITNIVFWRPPGNRNPSIEEIEICKPFVERQIELVNPKAILILGAPAAKSLLDSQAGILKLRGQWKTLTLNDKSYPTMASLHPAYLLRTPTAKMLAWQDMLAVKKKLTEVS